MQGNLAHIKRALIEIGFFSFFVNALMLVMPLYMLQVYDRILPSSSIDTLLFLSLIAAGALLLLAVLEFVRGVYANRMAARLDVSNSRDALLAAMASPKAMLGDIQSMRDLSTVRTFVASRTVFALFDLPFAPLFIVLLWLIHPTLFWITALGAVLLAAIAMLNQRMTSAPTRTGSQNAMAEMITAQSFVRNAETLRSMGMIENALGVWAGHHTGSLSANDDVARINAFFTGLSRFFRMGLQIAVLGTGAWLVLRGEMTAGMIFASSIISGRGLQPIDQVIGGWRQFVDVQAAWRRFSSAVSGMGARREYTDLPVPKGELTVENLVYFAPGARTQPEPILKRLNFSVPAGVIVCVIGRSGAGKSTMARLIVGAQQPSGGIVRMDGADIRNWDPEVLGTHMGYLPQDVEILPGTIAQNIARFDPDASDTDIIKAARRAQVHELVQTMPGGYDTQIGPGGMILSGGQRQRIGLARAFYGDPCLLVLDEPNANLDIDGERALERALAEARQTKTTVLIISQRKSVARLADMLLLLRKGAIEDFGPRDEVLARRRAKSAEAAATGRETTESAAREEKIAANANSGASAGDAGSTDAAPDADAAAPPPATGKSPFAGYGPGLRPVAKNGGNRR